MQTYLTEGIILKVLDFRDFDQIVTVFTENEGVLKFIAKKGNAFKRGLKNSPLTRSEFVYSIGRSELYKIHELSLKESFLNLRQDLKKLTLSCECLKSILKTQELHKPAPHLYKLLLAYLRKIDSLQNQNALLASFKLKILNHEGILNLGENESFYSHQFSREEFSLMEQLAEESSFSELEKMDISCDLSLKISSFFDEAY